MTAATATRLKDRLQDVIALTIAGTESEDHCDGACGYDECAQLEADSGTLTAAFRAIDQAPDDEAALAIYLECFVALTGIPAQEWSVGVVAATGGGEK